MFIEIEKRACVDAKEIFDTRYRISSFSLSKIMDRMVFAGGAFASILLNTPPRDIDLFILNSQPEDFAIFDNYAKANNYPIDAKITKNPKYDNINPRITSVWKMTRNNVNYDIIFTDYMTPEAVISDFDYLHSKVWFYSGKLYISHSTFRAIMDMKLIPASDKPISKERREKFIARGWKE